MEGLGALCREEDNNLVLAVTRGGELDDRETLVIEDEMDGLRMGGWSSEGGVRSQLARKWEERMYSRANHKCRWNH